MILKDSRNPRGVNVGAFRNSDGDLANFIDIASNAPEHVYNWKQAMENTFLQRNPDKVRKELRTFTCEATDCNVVTVGGAPKQRFCSIRCQERQKKRNQAARKRGLTGR